jgi:pimeloyl-ACP methyl ester carboxylesterase
MTNDQGARQTHVVTSDGLRLAAFEQGNPSAPTVVLVHGYPDNHHVWDGVATDLATDFHVVAYDVRGSGLSEVPSSRKGYRIEQLVDDLGRVIDAASPDAPVHLVAHDWGSIQVWDGLTADRLAPRVSTFTSISGPSLDHAATWLRSSAAGARPRLRQLLSSYYIGLFMAPVLPELAARRGVIDRLVEHSAAADRGVDAPPTARQDRGEAETVNGIELYRANFPRRMLRPSPPRIDLPVQVIAPDSDHHVSPALQAGAPAPYVRDLTVHHVAGSHWVVSQRPALVAAMVRDHAGAVSQTDALGD